MARFKVDFCAGDYGFLDAYDDVLSVDDLLDVLRPAALHLRDAYRHTLTSRFKRQSGQLCDSIDIDDGYSSGSKYGRENNAYIHVGPSGRRKNSKRKARSRAGPADRKYAKHNRTAAATRLSNAELAYLLEYGTPRIKATHWMENTNEACEGEVQQMINDEFDRLLERKGLK